MTNIWEQGTEEIFGPNRKQYGNITKWGKAKFSLEQAKQAQRGSKSIALLCL
jgi:hypothetical protein